MGGAVAQYKVPKFNSGTNNKQNEQTNQIILERRVLTVIFVHCQSGSFFSL